MRVAKWLLVACLALVVVGVAACGDEEDKTAARAGGALNPCALITQQEAAEALGGVVQAGKLRQTANPLGQRICFYEGRSAAAMRFVQISLVTTAGLSEDLRRSGYSAAKLFQDSKKLLGRPKPVKGLGQEAFWGGSGLKAGAGLHVLARDVYLNISVAAGDARRDLEAAKVLAQKALARLP